MHLTDVTKFDGDRVTLATGRRSNMPGNFVRGRWGAAFPDTSVVHGAMRISVTVGA
jgi:hypothetical protein